MVGSKTVSVGSAFQYDCSREEAVFIIVGRGGDQFIFEFIAAN